ncbi:hypothetical protein [Bacteroides thetaiotaomicron]
MQLITKLKSNMKGALMSVSDRLLADLLMNRLKAKGKRYRSVISQNHPASYYIMKRHTWLIGAVLPPCGQIPVTK